MDANKEKALLAALTQIERQFGKGTVMRMGDKEQVAIPSISTGSIGLDVALGIGGLPKGRIVEIYGPESSGKTTLTLQVIAEAQRMGGTCAFIDAEHALDPIYASKNFNAPWLGLTGFFVVAAMLSLLVFAGEAVRDAFDPRKTFG